MVSPISESGPTPIPPDPKETNAVPAFSLNSTPMADQPASSQVSATVNTVVLYLGDAVAGFVFHQQNWSLPLLQILNPYSAALSPPATPTNGQVATIANSLADIINNALIGENQGDPLLSPFAIQSWKLIAQNLTQLATALTTNGAPPSSITDPLNIINDLTANGGWSGGLY